MRFCVIMLFVCLGLTMPAWAKQQKRDYEGGVSEKKRHDIVFIVRTLSEKQDLELVRYAFKLERAGNRIEDVHTLRFLEVIFTDGELIAGIHNIHNNGGWVWDRFMKNIDRVLNEETALGNVTAEQVKDFANNVGIKAEWILPTIDQHNWDDLVEILLDKVERPGQPERYNI